MTCQSKVLGCGVMLALWMATGARVEAAASRSVPLDDRLVYDISWLGVQCGEMTLESAPVDGKPALVRMLMTVRTSEIFDRVYKVRAEIESIYNIRQGSTRSYHEQSSEKDKAKDDLWQVNFHARKAHRNLNGRKQVFDLPEGGGHDPLAMLYRLRALATEPGVKLAITVITTHGSVEARALVERWERFETPSGEVTALKVVQQAVGDGEFARGSGMTMWLANDRERTPYRIEFDMPFGTLVAALARDSRLDGDLERR
jgi:hypothetical protein